MHYSNIDSVHKVHLYFAAIGVNTCEGQSATEIFGLAAKHEISTSLHPYQETPTHEKNPLPIQISRWPTCTIQIHL